MFLDSLVDLVPAALDLFVVLFVLSLRDWQWEDEEERREEEEEREREKRSQTPACRS